MEIGKAETGRKSCESGKIFFPVSTDNLVDKTAPRGGVGKEEGRRMKGKTRGWNEIFVKKGPQNFVFLACGGKKKGMVTKMGVKKGNRKTREA